MKFLKEVLVWVSFVCLLIVVALGITCGAQLSKIAAAVVNALQAPIQVSAPVEWSVGGRELTLTVIVNQQVGESDSEVFARASAALDKAMEHEHRQ